MEGKTLGDYGYAADHWLAWAWTPQCCPLRDPWQRRQVRTWLIRWQEYNDKGDGQA